MCFYIDDPSTIWDAHIVRARKLHYCDECYAETIQPGQLYERVGSLFDGRWDTVRTCSECLSLREAVIAHEIAEGCARSEATPPVGELWASASDVGVVVERQHWDDMREEAAS